MTKIKSGARRAASQQIAAGMERVPGTGRFARKLPAAGEDHAGAGAAAAEVAPVPGSGTAPGPASPPAPAVEGEAPASARPKDRLLSRLGRRR